LAVVVAVVADGLVRGQPLQSVLVIGQEARLVVVDVDARGNVLGRYKEQLARSRIPLSTCRRRRTSG
jgi:hypothetical protein